jgi:hypothetical protein
MSGIPSEVAEHTHNVRSGTKPIKKHLRCFNEEKCKVIGQEIAKLLKSSDMSGIPSEVAEHTHNVRSGTKPIKKHLCCFNEEKCKVIGQEIAKLLVVVFIMEDQYP